MLSNPPHAAKGSRPPLDQPARDAPPLFSRGTSIVKLEAQKDMSGSILPVSLRLRDLCTFFLCFLTLKDAGSEYLKISHLLE